MDPAPDEAFYAFERKVVHIETGAIEALREAYAEVLPAGGRVLDLMSSWRSHLPYTGLGPVIGPRHERRRDGGQPAARLVRRPQPEPRTGAAVRRRGRSTRSSCAVSVQYLTQPVDVFRDVRRVLTNGGPFVVSFSNRCFPTKAVAIWLANGDGAHRTLVRTYFERAGFEAIVRRASTLPRRPALRGAGHASHWPRDAPARQESEHQPTDRGGTP